MILCFAQDGSSVLNVTQCHHLTIVFPCRFFWAQQPTGYQEKTTETLSTPSTAPTTWQGERERENFDHLTKNLALALPVVLSNLKSVNSFGPSISLL